MRKELGADYRELVHTPDVWEQLWENNAVLSPEVLGEVFPAYRQFQSIPDKPNIWSKTGTIDPVEPPVVVTLHGPTAAGKDWVNEPEHIFLPNENIITTTTRLIRTDQPTGDRYHFVSQAEFTEMKKKKEFFEYVKQFGDWYGTTNKEVEEKLQKATIAGTPFVLWRANIQGFQTFAPKIFKKYHKVVQGISLLPHMPIRAYYEHIQRERGIEDARKRWPRAQREIQEAPIVDYLLENRFDKKNGKQDVINDFNYLISRLCASC